MNELFATYAIDRLQEIIRAELDDTGGNRNVFVLLGLSDIVVMDGFKDKIVDPATFSVDGNGTVFNEDEWFDTIRSELRKDREFSIMSYQQFVYYMHYAPNLSGFKERVIIVHDNVRTLFPIPVDAYVEKTGAENLEERQDSMPLYHSEQVSIEGETYCSYVIPTECRMVGFFRDTLPVEPFEGECTEMLEIDEHMHSLDVALNHALRKPSAGTVLGVKLAKGILREEEIRRRLALANGFLARLGAGKVVLVKEPSLRDGYVPREETLALLKRYWGEEASFRSIRVYRSPGESNDLMDISQGEVVDVIIDEYGKSRCSEKLPRDIFITAPTGAGKSLLFQIPAFHVSGCGDVTVVISPLIALMKDQVSAIIRDRHFTKVAFLNSDLTLVDRDRLIAQCKEGEIDILYMSPELLLSYDISFFIGERRLGLVVIDEAHLITTWGRDFRVDYWHLGNHINKIRKYRGMNFPVVALTATAIYSGPNDMVVDSMSSLYMHDPHLYLGQVKREDIRFVVNNYESFEGGYKQHKLQQTADFIREIDKHHLKTVVYAPYTIHVNDIVQSVGDIAVPYYGTLPAEQRDYAYSLFRSNEKLVMVCTKAFGMGVDIPDIQVIYHHAPSGLLPDYVQEIGRAARLPGMTGFAALNYNERDKQYSKQLFGMSSIRQWQIREVLKKVYSLYNIGGRKRNLLISADDFGYIFDDGDDAGTKLKTALMMIEKDYLTRARYNVLIARPKQLFVKCYARTNEYGLSVLRRKYPDSFTEIRKLGAQTVVMLDLDEIWKKDFSNMSFGLLKRRFFMGELLGDDRAVLVPLSRYTLTLNQEFGTVKERFFRLLDSLESVFASLGTSVFTDDCFITALEEYYPDRAFCRSIARYALSAFSGRMVSNWEIEQNAFLQRREYEGTTYKVFSQAYRTMFSNMKSILLKMFEDTDRKSASRFFSNENDNSITYSRLGSLVELIGVGTFECQGGDSPMIFVRLNDPERIRQDSENESFRNELLSRTARRHEISCEIFDHFFTSAFTSDQRWDYIEDFFLGATNEDLFEKYPETGERNHVDIVRYIVDNVEYVRHHGGEPGGDVAMAAFPPREGGKYFRENLLTIEGRTMDAEEWVNRDPVTFDRARRQYRLDIAKDLFSALMSKLRIRHPEYYKDMMGLKMPIEFKGYSGLIPASVPYSNDPVAFYKWWKKAENQEKVTLSKVDQVRLFIKVNEMEPKALLKRHREMVVKN